MKTEFELDKPHYFLEAKIEIIGTAPEDRPYVSISLTRSSVNWHDTSLHIKDKDLERFAVNILKALKSDKLK